MANENSHEGRNSGWVKLHRSSFENDYYFSEKFTRWQAWSDLILLANYADGWIRIRGIRQPVTRGQIGLPVPKLAARWQWSKGKVIRFLNELKMDSQIGLQKTNVTTLISILNYDTYQPHRSANKSPNEITDESADKSANGKNSFVTNVNTSELQASKKNKKNKEEIRTIRRESKERKKTRAPILKKEKLKKPISREPRPEIESAERSVPSLEEVQRVFASNGGTDEMAQAFYNTRESTGWKKQGDPIVNFASMVYGFITNWKKNEERDNQQKIKQNGKSGKGQSHTSMGSGIGRSFESDEL